MVRAKLPTGGLRRFIRKLTSLAAGTPLLAGHRQSNELIDEETSSASSRVTGEMPLAVSARCADPSTEAKVADQTHVTSTVDAEVLGTGTAESQAVDDIDPQLERGLVHIQQYQWSRAQRALEEAIRHDQSGEAKAYLADVRAVRRHLRQLDRWPRDPLLHLQLGRLYFGLELGDRALEEFRRVVQLDPEMAEGHFHLALEHLFRGEEEQARHAAKIANDLNPELPSYEALESAMAASSEELSETATIATQTSKLASPRAS